MMPQPTMLLRRPRLWPYLVAVLPLTVLWVVGLEGWNLTHPSESIMAFADPKRRLFVWLIPLLLIAAVFAGRWIYLAAQARAQDRQVAAEQAEQAKQQNDAAAQAAAVLARKRETLEVLGFGLVVEMFRNAQVWDAIRKVENEAFASILPKEPEVVRGDLVRDNRSGKRGGDVFEYAQRYFVEKIPLPGFVVFPKPTGKEPSHWEVGAGTLMGERLPFTLFITAGQIYSDTPDEALGVIFDFFDQHPDVPAVFVYADDGYMTKKFFRDGYQPDGDPGWKPGDPTEAMTAFVLVRRDRVDKLIRPYVVSEPYQVELEDKTSFVNRVWRFFFALKKTHSDSALPTVEEWLAETPTLMAQIGQVPVSSLLPFWERPTGGFKPSPFMPVPWAKWQLEEFDALPTLGYLHRPQYAAYREGDKPLAQAAQAEAFAAAWRAALETLADGQAPERLFFDAGNDAERGRGLIPMARAFSEHFPGKDWLDAPTAIDLSARLGDTGAASPFVQIALAIIASYREGGVSATANLRRADGASVLMVSPPREPPAERKTHPGAGSDPFKVKLSE